MAISFFNTGDNIRKAITESYRQPQFQSTQEQNTTPLGVTGTPASDYYKNRDSVPTGTPLEQYRQSQNNLYKAYRSGDLEKQFMGSRQFDDAEAKMANAELDPTQIDPNTGNTLGFQEKIRAILGQGNRAVALAENPNHSVNFSSTVARNLENAPDWARQKPFEMGYEWNEDVMRQNGLTDADIADYRTIKTMDPRMIENLYSRGFLRAPYREYLAEQARLQAIAEEQARQAALAARSYAGGNEGNDNPPPPPPAVVQPSHNFTGDIESKSVPGNDSVMSDVSNHESAAQRRHRALYGRPNKFLQ